MAVVGTLWRSAVMLSPTWSDRSVSQGAGLCRRSIDLFGSSPFRGSGIPLSGSLLLSVCPNRLDPYLERGSFT
jgi:hypothetical protein